MNHLDSVFDKHVRDYEEIWTKQYDKGVERHLSLPNNTLKGIIQHWATVQPDKPHIIFDDEILTYQESNTLACKLANGLLKLGAKKGDRIAAILPNVPEIILSFMACYKTGFIATAYNPRSTERELTHYFLDNDAVTVIVTAEYADKVINVMQEGKTSLRNVIVVHCSAEQQQNDRVFDFYQFLDQQDDAEPEVEIFPDDKQILLYTGGTTGISKGCCVTNRKIIGHENAFINWYSPVLDNEDWRILMCLPFTHALAINMGINWCLVAGGTVIVLDTITNDALIETIDKHNPTIWVAVPALINQLIYDPRVSKSHTDLLKLVLVGSAPLAVDTLAHFKKFTDATVVEGFGMTESVCAVTFNPTQAGKLGSIGIPFVDTDVLIVDSKDGTTVLPPNQKGEIIYRGPQVIEEYWNKPEETAHAVRNGWLYSGDIGYMDEDGYFYIVDRKKDMINTGGFNVYPREIDELLFKHPNIYASCTVGVPEPRLGEVAMSFIVVQPGDKLSADEVITYCRQYLTAYKVPRHIVFVKEIPLTKSNKPDKEVLRRRAREIVLYDEKII